MLTGVNHPPDTKNGGHFWPKFGSVGGLYDQKSSILTPFLIHFFRWITVILGGQMDPKWPPKRSFWPPFWPKWSKMTNFPWNRHKKTSMSSIFWTFFIPTKGTPRVLTKSTNLILEFPLGFCQNFQKSIKSTPLWGDQTPFDLIWTKIRGKWSFWPLFVLQIPKNDHFYIDVIDVKSCSAIANVNIGCCFLVRNGNDQFPLK